MRRLLVGTRLLVLAAAGTFVVAQDAATQWARSSQTNAAGHWECVNGEHRVETDVAKGASATFCRGVQRAWELAEGLLGMSVAQAQLALILPPPSPPPPPSPLPDGWSDVTIDGGVLTWSSTLSYNDGTGEFSIDDTGGSVFGTSDHTRVFARTGGVAGDMTLTARVTATDIDGAPLAAAAFLRISESADGNSANVRIGTRGATGRRLYERATTGGSTATLVTDTAAVTLPMCYRFSVDADNGTVRGEQSDDCMSYTQMGSDRPHSWLGGTYHVALGGSANLDSDPTAENHVVWDSVVFSTDPVDHAPGGGTSDTPDYDDPVAGVTVGTQTVVPIANNTALDAAIAAGLQCGRDYVLASGSYSGTKTWDDGGACAATAPIRIVGTGATGTFAAALTGTQNITGTRLIFTNLYFNGGMINFRGNNNKLIANRFANTSGGWSIIASGSAAAPAQNGEIALNNIEPPVGACALADGFKQFAKIFGGEPEDQHVGLWIHGNQAEWTTACHQGDWVEFGEANYDWVIDDDPEFLSGIYIEDNLIVSFASSAPSNAAEIIDAKLGGVVVRRNTVLSANGERISIRMGRDSIVEGNWLEGTATISALDFGHKIVCNRIASGEYWVYAGTDVIGTVGGSQIQASDVLVGRNIGTLRVGKVHNANYDEPALATLIREHTGTIILDNQSGTINESAELSDYDCEPAVEIDASDAGADALSSADAGYLAARGF